MGVREKIGGVLKPALLAAATIPLVALAACSCPQRVGVAPTSKDGRSLYLARCASCHGIDGKGDGPAAAALSPAPTDLTRLAQRYGGNFPREYVLEVVTGEREIVAHGSRAMPVWSQRFGPSGGATAVASVYTRSGLERLIDYVETLQLDAAD